MTGTAGSAERTATTTKPSRIPSVLMGVGLGGFIDGIVLHQILQWHHMVSDTEANPVTTVQGLETNTLADGLFHAATWVFVVLGMCGLIAAWRQERRAPSPLFHVGLLLIGWGVFNVVEGLIAHQLLGVHHVRDDVGAPQSWDIGFLILGGLLIVVGWALQKVGDKQRERST